MWPSKKQTKKTAPVSDAAAKLIASGIIKCQCWLTRNLQRLEHRCSYRQKIAVALLLLLICFGYCSYLLGTALFASRNRNILPAAATADERPPILPPVMLSPDSVTRKN